MNIKLIAAILIFVLGSVAYTTYRQYSDLSAIKSQISATPQTVVETPSPSTSAPLQSPTASPRLSPHKTIVPVATKAPTPTPKPKIDYYLSSTSQILVPENTIGVTEYTQTQTYPKMRLEADFAANNAAAGDVVEMKIYEDGLLQQTKNQQVYSTTNFHFADVYYAKARSVGTHTVKFVYNENRAVEESNYNNNEANFTFKILAENIPPTFTIDGPVSINGQTCLRWIDLQDNVSVYTDVWAKWKIDDGSWSNRTSENPYGCITGVLGSSHIYTVHAEDAAGNIKEEIKNFTIY